MTNYSIIIPHKNSPLLLNRCLESIPKRNDIEIIIIDDFSKEDCKPQVTREDAKVIQLTEKESKGAGRARNVGLKHAKGKWLLFADCDDYYINDAFIKLDRFRDTDYDIIFFNYDTNLNRKEDSFQRKLEAMINGKKRDRANFKHLSNTAWNKMYKRQFVIDNNILFDEIPRQNDAYFVHKASYLTDNFFYINEKLYFYELRPTGITRNQNPSKKESEIIINTRIKIDKLKARSGAWDYIYFNIGKKYRKNGIMFLLRQQLRRIRHGLLWYIIRKKI